LEIEEHASVIGEHAHAGRTVGEQRIARREGPDDHGRFIQGATRIGFGEADTGLSTCA
jgi:hypothetical protein